VRPDTTALRIKNKANLRAAILRTIVEFAFMSYGYIPAPAPMTLPKSWFSRNWKWFIPTAVLSLVLAVALTIGALLTFVIGLLKSRALSARYRRRQQQSGGCA
jgi:hypothetical protein